MVDRLNVSIARVLMRQELVNSRGVCPAMFKKLQNMSCKVTSKSTDSKIPLSLEAISKKEIVLGLKVTSKVDIGNDHPRCVGGGDVETIDQGISNDSTTQESKSSGDVQGSLDSWETIVVKAIEMAGSYSKLEGESYHIPQDRSQDLPTTILNVKNTIMFDNIPPMVEDLLPIGKHQRGLKIKSSLRWDLGNILGPGGNDVLYHNENVPLVTDAKLVTKRTHPARVLYDLPVPDSVASKLLGVDTTMDTSKVWRSVFGGKDDQLAARVAASMLLGSGRTDNHIVFFVRAWTYYFNALLSTGAPVEVKAGRSLSSNIMSGGEAKDWHARFVVQNQVPVRSRSVQLDLLNFLNACCTNGQYAYEYYHRVDVGSVNAPDLKDFNTIYSQNAILTIREMVLICDRTPPSGSYTPKWVQNPGLIASYITNYARENGLMSQVIDAYLLAGSGPQIGIESTFPEPVHTADAFCGMLESSSQIDPAVYGITEHNPIGTFMGFYLYAQQYKESWRQLAESILLERPSDAVDASALTPVARIMSMDKVSAHMFTCGLPKLMTSNDYFFTQHTSMPEEHLFSLTDIDGIKSGGDSLLAKLLISRYHTKSIAGLFRIPKMLGEHSHMDVNKTATHEQQFIKYLLRYDSPATEIVDLKSAFYRTDNSRYFIPVHSSKVEQLSYVTGVNGSLKLLSVSLANKGKKKMSSLDKYESFRTKILSMFTSGASGYSTNPEKEKKAEEDAQRRLREEEVEEIAREEARLPDPDSPEFRRELDTRVESLFPIPQQDLIKGLISELDQSTWVAMECGGGGDCGPGVLNTYAASIGLETTKMRLRNAVARELGYRPKKGSWFHEVDMMAGADSLNVGLVYDLGENTPPHVAVAKQPYIYVRNVGNYHWQLMVHTDKKSDPQVLGINSDPAHKGARGGDPEPFSIDTNIPEMLSVKDIELAIPNFQQTKGQTRKKMRDMIVSGLISGISNEQIIQEATLALSSNFGMDHGSSRATGSKKNRSGANKVGVSTELCQDGLQKVVDSKIEPQSIKSCGDGSQTDQSHGLCMDTGSTNCSQMPPSVRKAKVVSGRRMSTVTKSKTGKQLISSPEATDVQVVDTMNIVEDTPEQIRLTYLLKPYVQRWKEEIKERLSKRQNKSILPSPSEKIQEEERLI